MQTVYGLITDWGDGNANLTWFRIKELVDELLEGRNAESEIFHMNDGVPASTLIFSDETDLAAAGFLFSDEHYTHLDAMKKHESLKEKELLSFILGTEYPTLDQKQRI